MSEKDNVERRRYTRVQFDAEASVNQGDYFADVKLLDISLNGVLIETPRTYSIKTNEDVTLKIVLSDETVITMEMRLAHSGDEILGFQCHSIDMESISHLRRLIELNIGNPNASERVLDELILPH